MQSLTQQFLTFCRSKPEGERYNYFSFDEGETGCAVTQFMHARGIRISDKPWADLHMKVGDQLLGYPRTFSALATRLASLPTPNAGDAR